MRKFVALLAMAASSQGFAAPYDLYMNQMNMFGSGTINRQLSVPNSGIGVDGVLYYNGTTTLPAVATLGTGCSISSGVFTCTGATSGTVTSGGITSSNLAVTGTPVTTSGNIAVSLPNVGTAGTYSGVTTDAQGRVTAGTNMVINDAPGRSLVTSTSATGFQVSATRNARVCYEGSFATTSTIGGPASASVFIETADTNSTTPSDWTVRAQQTYTNTITLAVVLNQVQSNNWAICRDIAAGKFVRIRAGSISGTASVSLNATQQETTY